MKRIAIAQDTLKIIEDGCYLSPEGKQVKIDRQLASCLAGTAYYEPEALSAIQENILSGTPQFSNEFMVRNETTLVGAERTARSYKFAKIAVLNFASAKNPGGGFIKGAKAQEESLARSSALDLLQNNFMI
ncbi:MULTISPECIES: TIGR02452 family protein [unclassified Microcoleus]|uniref:TIGR02452 family protein n=1 Tax=unclassified Microcoleus TaxID=2642155 RepID=UPI002FD25052